MEEQVHMMRGAVAAVPGERSAQARRLSPNTLATLSACLDGCVTL